MFVRLLNVLVNVETVYSFYISTKKKNTIIVEYKNGQEEEYTHDTEEQVEDVMQQLEKIINTPYTITKEIQISKSYERLLENQSKLIEKLLKPNLDLVPTPLIEKMVKNMWEDEVK